MTKVDEVDSKRGFGPFPDASGVAVGVSMGIPRYLRAASTIARMPARIASGKIGQASKTRCSSGSILGFTAVSTAVSSREVSEKPGFSSLSR